MIALPIITVLIVILQLCRVCRSRTPPSRSRLAYLQINVISDCTSLLTFHNHTPVDSPHRNKSPLSLLIRPLKPLVTKEPSLRHPTCSDTTILMALDCVETRFHKSTVWLHAANGEWNVEMCLRDFPRSTQRRHLSQLGKKSHHSPPVVRAVAILAVASVIVARRRACPTLIFTSIRARMMRDNAPTTSR